jgi:nicotinic acid phosphoribosyltransferase
MTSILATDGYKFSMGQAGFPLRRETFYFSFRRGGWHFNPFDLEAEVQALVPTPPTAADYEYLAANNYRLTEAMRRALEGTLEIRAIPQGVWFGNREPILTVTGPSFLVSLIEARLTWLNYGIQLATELKKNPDSQEELVMIGQEHCRIVQKVIELVGINRPIFQTDDYPRNVRKRAVDIADSLRGGDVGLRLIEGGLRAALCLDHHDVVLDACNEVGIVRTSNVLGAHKHGMIPSGTAGHEHSQRCGDDRTAYRNYMDRVCGLVSCLSDTTDTLRSGLPATVEIASANPDRQFLFRLDSGDRKVFFHAAANEFKRRGLDNIVINVAGDVDAPMIREFEELRELIGWEANRLSYMIGGQLTAATLPTPLTRSRVAAVFKLCQTGERPTMKISDDEGEGKRSIPGQPVTWRRLRGDGPVGIIGQAGETPPENYAVLNGNPEVAQQLRIVRAEPRLTNKDHYIWGDDPIPQVHSEGTSALIAKCEAEHETACAKIR